VGFGKSGINLEKNSTLKNENRSNIEQIASKKTILAEMGAP